MHNLVSSEVVGHVDEETHSRRNETSRVTHVCRRSRLGLVRHISSDPSTILCLVATLMVGTIMVGVNLPAWARDLPVG